jgi:hypothetical protein
MFGRVIFDPPLDYAFGRIGVMVATVGIVTSAVVFVLLAQNGSLEQMWFWLTFSGLLIFVGGQLVMSWIVLRVLEELARRETTTQQDLTEPAPAVEMPGDAIPAPSRGIKP